MSEHSVTGNSAQALSGKVLDKMMKVLETESHEGTLVQALTALSAWTAKFTTDIPQKLIDFVPVSEGHHILAMSEFLFTYFSCPLKKIINK